MKLHRKVAELLGILNKMYHGLNAIGTMNDDVVEEFYSTRFSIGFGDEETEIYLSPETFETFEVALANLLCLVIEDEDLEKTEPYASLYEHYGKLAGRERG